LINPYDREQNIERVVHIYGHVHGSGQGHVTLGLGQLVIWPDQIE